MEDKGHPLSPFEEELIKKISEENGIEVNVLRKCYSLIQKESLDILRLIPEGEKAHVSAKTVEVIKVTSLFDDGKKFIRVFSKTGRFLMASLSDFQ